MVSEDNRNILSDLSDARLYSEYPFSFFKTWVNCSVCLLGGLIKSLDHINPFSFRPPVEIWFVIANFFDKVADGPLIDVKLMKLSDGL